MHDAISYYEDQKHVCGADLALDSKKFFILYTHTVSHHAGCSILKTLIVFDYILIIFFYMLVLPFFLCLQSEKFSRRSNTAEC